MTEKRNFRAVVVVGHTRRGRAPGTTAVYPEALSVSLALLDDEDCGWGRRLVGHGDAAKNLIRVELDEDDAREIRRILDGAFPPAAEAAGRG